MQGQAPSVGFVATFCECYDVSADWLLTGLGRKHRHGLDEEMMRSIPSELLFKEAGRRLARVERNLSVVGTYAGLDAEEDD
ncbi:MAG: hypothetical protein CMJ31_13905 [Phycisphaerae bacterium]|nr:hypothetical protein [Phycisphaerae bacterium]